MGLSAQAMEVMAASLQRIIIRDKCLQKLMICSKRAKNNLEFLWAAAEKKVAVVQGHPVMAAWDEMVSYSFFCLLLVCGLLQVSTRLNQKKSR